ncbi:hypothetical protein PAE9249_02267 [Paenibacillus sp. CECT 9249]|nr:hypothetical protein PAE9249_02267 [Paenibacillus sp. CECT 9249]
MGEMKTVYKCMENTSGTKYDRIDNFEERMKMNL